MKGDGTVRPGRLDWRLFYACQFDMYSVADSQLAALIMQGILSEIDLILPFSGAIECRERFLAGLRGFRVDSRNGAPGAGFGEPEVYRINGDFAPAVFCIGGTAGNNQIGPETGHW